jgi:hypothetical protein
LKNSSLADEGADDEQRIDIGERLRYLGKESVRIVRMLGRLATPFRMTVKMVLWREDRCRIGRVRMNVKNAGLVVIDPGDGVSRHGGLL